MHLVNTNFELFFSKLSSGFGKISCSETSVKNVLTGMSIAPKHSSRTIVQLAKELKGSRKDPQVRYLTAGGDMKGRDDWREMMFRWSHVHTHTLTHKPLPRRVANCYWSVSRGYSYTRQTDDVKWPVNAQHHCWEHRETFLWLCQLHFGAWRGKYLLKIYEG